jgi:hypothetical protein
MRPAKVRRLLYFAKRGNGVLPPSAFREAYGLEPNGMNFYYGLNAAARRHLRETGAALQPSHRAFFDMVQEWLFTGPKEAMVDLGLWPYEPADPYGFVAANEDLIRAVARELHAYQERAEQHGARLRIVVRYASEMNDPAKPGQPWGRPRAKYEPSLAEPFRRTFRLVRETFREHAPAVRFAFSPAIRADIAGERYAMIADFWPGEGLADVVSCTWYVGRAAHLQAAIEALERHFSDRAAEGLPFGIDEMGGIDGAKGNDAVLEAMFAALDALKQPAELEYASIFLHGKWGTDASLSFLRRPHAG